MIISCEKCQTKYRLDSSRVSYSPVKVQCSKCDHIFIVPASGVRTDPTEPAGPVREEAQPPDGVGAQGQERGPDQTPPDQGPEAGAEEEGPLSQAPPSPEDLTGETAPRPPAEESAGEDLEGRVDQGLGSTAEEEGPSLSLETGPESASSEAAEEERRAEEDTARDLGGEDLDSETYVFNPDVDKGPELMSSEEAGREEETIPPGEEEEEEGAEPESEGLAEDKEEEDEAAGEGLARTEDREKKEGTSPLSEVLKPGEEGEEEGSQGLGEDDLVDLSGPTTVEDDAVPPEGIERDSGPEETGPDEEPKGEEEGMQGGEKAVEETFAPGDREGFEHTFETNALSFEALGERVADEQEGPDAGPSEEADEIMPGGAETEKLDLNFEIGEGDFPAEKPDFGVKEEWETLPEGPWSSSTDEAKEGKESEDLPLERMEVSTLAGTGEHPEPRGPGDADSDKERSEGVEKSSHGEETGDETGPATEDEGAASSGETTADEANTFVIPDVPPEVERIKGTGVARAIAIVIIVLAIAGGVVYMKTRPESPLMVPPPLERTIEIKSTKGYYVLNKEGTRFFVIETMVRNMSDGPVKIKGVRGMVMDSSGREMARKTVSPGRVVSRGDLRQLPVKTLLRSFRDTSEATMPKRAVIPTMVIFPDLPGSVAEYEVDILG